MVEATNAASGEKKGDLWLRAAVVGGLWASLEIIVGSFLHNTKLPFAGSMLAFAGTVLLIGFYQVWPMRGLIIRAGLITAIMKSVSPSAIILGPMMGIMLEAMLLELMILLFGSNTFGFIVAGIASVSSALFYKLFSLLIFFGFDLIRVYVNIVNFALKQFSLQQAAPVEILMALLLVYAVFGILAALMGKYIGKKALGFQNNGPHFTIHEKGKKTGNFFDLKNTRKASSAMLLLHIIAVPVGLFLLNALDNEWGYVFIAIYVILIGLIYRKALRRLRKPFFWMQLFIIVVLSALFWEIGKKDTGWFSIEGFWVGLEMVFRAVFVIIAFSAISVELKNEKVRTFIFNAGMGRFYQAVGMAFAALPMMISFLPSSKDIVRHPLQSLLKPLVMADEWLEVMRKDELHIE